MKIKYILIYLILIIVILNKSNIMSFFACQNNIKVESIYEEKLKKELKDIDLIDKVNIESNYIYGKVFYQNPYKFNEELVILTDTNNLKRNDYVINESGFIGIVDKIYKNYIIVKMISSKDFIIQVSVNDCYGILQNNRISNIKKICNVKENDEVYTSNLGYLDEKIFLGKIINVSKDSNDIEDIYNFKKSVNLNNLNYVVIITGEK